jgi:hypothetical protein
LRCVRARDRWEAHGKRGEADADMGIGAISSCFEAQACF